MKNSIRLLIIALLLPLAFFVKAVIEGSVVAAICFFLLAMLLLIMSDYVRNNLTPAILKRIKKRSR